MKQQAITLLLGAAALVSAPCGFAEEPATEVAAPSDTVVTFTAVHEGTATVTLVYARPWESKAPLKSRTFIVTVTK